MTVEAHLRRIIEDAFQALADVSGDPLDEIVRAFIDGFEGEDSKQP